MADLKTYIPNLGQNGSVTVGSSDMNPTVVQYASVVIPSASILTLGSTNVQILPAPGSNFGYVISDIAVDIAAGTAYAAGGTAAFYYNTGTTSGFLVTANSVPNAAFLGTLGTTVYIAPTTTTTQIWPNQPLTMGQTGTTAFTTGNESVTVNVWYATIPIGH